MSIEISDYPDVVQRSSDLGIKPPVGACILPRRFAHAKEIADLCHESSSIDLKVIFREAELPIAVYQPEGTMIPYLQENDNTWVGPTLFFSAAVISQHPHIVSLALSVIANYVTDMFKGSPGPNRARLSVVIETTKTKTTTKTTKKIDFDAPADKIKDMKDIIKEFE